MSKTETALKVKVILGTGITAVAMLLATTAKKKKFDISDVEKQWSIAGIYTPKPTKYRQIAHAILRLSKVR